MRLCRKKKCCDYVVALPLTIGRRLVPQEVHGLHMADQFTKKYSELRAA